MNTLLFHFYVKDDFESNILNKIHFGYLEYYHWKFDKSIFVICVDDPDDTALIKRAENKIIDLGFSNVTFIISKNSLYCDGKTAYDFFCKNLDSLDDMVFFAHNKGVTVPNFGEEMTNSTKYWIAGLYYMSLHYNDYADFGIKHNFNGPFYGSFLTYDEGIDNNSHAWFSGTFYWVNVGVLRNSEKYRKRISKLTLDDRGFAESFPGRVADSLLKNTVPTLFKNFYMKSGIDLYFKAKEALQYMLVDIGYKECIDLFEDIYNNINNGKNGY